MHGPTGSGQQTAAPFFTLMQQRSRLPVPGGPVLPGGLRSPPSIPHLVWSDSVFRSQHQSEVLRLGCTSTSPRPLLKNPAAQSHPTQIRLECLDTGARPQCSSKMLRVILFAAIWKPLASMFFMFFLFSAKTSNHST